jgi:hypothetical protein
MFNFNPDFAQSLVLIFVFLAKFVPTIGFLKNLHKILDITYFDNSFFLREL